MMSYEDYVIQRQELKDLKLQNELLQGTLTTYVNVNNDNLAQAETLKAQLGMAQSQLLSAQDIITTQDTELIAWKAENARLRNILEAIERRTPSKRPKARDQFVTEDTLILFGIGDIIRETLQPVEVSHADQSVSE